MGMISRPAGILIVSVGIFICSNSQAEPTSPLSWPPPLPEHPPILAGIKIDQSPFQQEVLRNLDQKTREFLWAIEAQTRMPVIFLKREKAPLMGPELNIDLTQNKMYLWLNEPWSSAEVAHELMHAHLELIEGFRMIAVNLAPPFAGAMSAATYMMSFINDQIVFTRLLSLGFKLDGEILQDSFFDEILPRITRNLEQGKPYAEDGLSMLDVTGYGDLMRSGHLVFSQLIMKNFGQDLSAQHWSALNRFITAFREYRPKEAAQADQVLQVIGDKDLQDIDDHQKVLEGWIRLSRLNNVAAMAKYQRRNSKYVLGPP